MGIRPGRRGNEACDVTPETHVGLEGCANSESGPYSRQSYRLRKGVGGT